MRQNHERTERINERTWARPWVAAAILGAVLTSAAPARAEEVSATGKGIVGGAFVGGELVIFAEAIFGVRSTAAYLIGAGLGAAAGGVGGYFLEQAVDDGRIPAYLLAGGLALVIPATVITLDQTRYLPPEGARKDKPVDAPPSDPGKPGGSTVIGAEPEPAPATPAPPPAAPPAETPAPPATPEPNPAAPAPAGGGGGGTPRSLVDFYGGTLRMAVPVPEVRPVFTRAQRAAFGVQNRGSELRFPVLAVTF